MSEHTCVAHTYYIAWMDDKSVIHVGEAETGQHIATGLDHLEVFADFHAWNARKQELGVQEE